MERTAYRIRLTSDFLAGAPRTYYVAARPEWCGAWLTAALARAKEWTLRAWAEKWIAARPEVRATMNPIVEAVA
jgi:hypothetical protein